MESDADRGVLQRFVARTTGGMVARGWEADPDRDASADSIFVGVFHQPIGSDWLATVEFILESGPIEYRVELRLTGPGRANRISAIVGGEIGLRHAPTARLLRELDVACEANIMRDLENIFEEEGADLPTITDEATADRASDTLVAAVDAHALPFARRHADVDAVVAFIAEGQQANRVPEFEYLFVPALLASCGRYSDARAALARFEDRPKSGPADESEYRRFADNLSAWLDNQAAANPT